MKDIFGIIVMAIVIIAVLLVLSPFFSGLSGTINTKQVKQGDTVKVEYTGTFDNGTVFDTLENSDCAHSLLQHGVSNRNFRRAQKHAPHFSAGLFLTHHKAVSHWSLQQELVR